MRMMLLILSLMIAPVYAGDYHRSEPVNVPDDGSNHNALVIGLFVAAAICGYTKCWKPKPVKAEANLIPEVPKNEYTYHIKP